MLMKTYHEKEHIINNICSNFQEVISITSENDLESSSMLDITPVKGKTIHQLDGNDATDEVTPQASRTREIKRVKIEK